MLPNGAAFYYAFADPNAPQAHFILRAHLSNAAYRERAEAIGAQLRAEDGAARAAELIEQLAFR